MTTKYRIAGIDATSALMPAEIDFPNYTITDTDGDFIEFEWWFDFESEPNNVMDWVLNFLDTHSRNIEVFTVYKLQTKEVVMTEENILPA